MPIITATTITLLTIAAQVGSSAWNFCRNKKIQKKMQKMSQDFEKRFHEENARFSRDELQRLLKANLDIEEDILSSRISYIENSFKSELELQVYTSSLDNWPLLVPPFVMKGNTLFYNDSLINHKVNVGMHCILAPSMDANFDRQLFPVLEDKVSSFLKKEYTTTTNHPVFFYQKAWKNDMEDVSALIKDLYAHTSTIPTLVISPRFDNEGELYFLFSYWGLGNDDNGLSSDFLNSRFIPKGVSVRFESMHKYLDDEIEAISNDLAVLLLGFIGYVADNYFWTYDKIEPLLPTLIDKKILELPSYIQDEYNRGYNFIYDTFMEKDINIILYPDVAVNLIRAMRSSNKDSLSKELWKRIASLRGFKDDYLNINLYMFSDRDRLFLKSMFGSKGSLISDKDIEKLICLIDQKEIIRNIPLIDIYH